MTGMVPSVPPGLADRLLDLLGPAGVLSGGDRAGFLAEERGLYAGRAGLVVRPSSTAEVAATLRLCAEAGVPVVPQGGNTGLVGGSVTAPGEVLLALGRMNRIRAIDPVDFTMVAESGCILATLQAKAAEVGCLFPLSLGAQGSCQIGGNLASNAGGINVLRYGNARDLTLGLEVVLPDGRIWNGLKALRKDNTGYDLKHLFIGSEGTLGIITAAVLKLFPALRDRQVAFCALPAADRAPGLLALARAAGDDATTAFELMNAQALSFAVRHGGGPSPFCTEAPWYALIELGTTRAGADLRGTLEDILAQALEQDLVSDAVLAESGSQAEALWRLRETLPEAQKREGGSIKHDVSVPVSAVPRFLALADAAVSRALPGVRICAFGHAGDGNVHYNLSQPPGMDRDAFLARWEEMNALVHDIVMQLGGSISAEHGIGLLKAAELVRYGDPVGLDLMRRMRDVLDPGRLMNPGKLVA